VDGAGQWLWSKLLTAAGIWTVLDCAGIHIGRPPLRQLVTFCPDVVALTTVQAEIPRKFRGLPAAAAKQPNLKTLSSRPRAAK
jgi:hypothetical protein